MGKKHCVSSSCAGKGTSVETKATNCVMCGKFLVDEKMDFDFLGGLLGEDLFGK